MQLARPVFAPDPRLFGRGRAREAARALAPEPRIPGQLKLFATTFLAGFVFVSVLIA